MEERHFALVDGFALPTVGSLRNRFRSGTQSDPCISSTRNCDHDYYFELLLFSEEEQDAKSIARCSTEHHRDIRAILRADQICSTAENPIPGASSNTTEPPGAAPSRPSPSCAHAASLSADIWSAIRAGCVPSPGPLPPAESVISNSLVW